MLWWSPWAQDHILAETCPSNERVLDQEEGALQARVAHSSTALFPGEKLALSWFPLMAALAQVWGRSG